MTCTLGKSQEASSAGAWCGQKWFEGVWESLPHSLEKAQWLLHFPVDPDGDGQVPQSAVQLPRGTGSGR